MNEYKRHIFSYGIISVLYVLEHYEKNENYEECSKIIEAIDFVKDDLGIVLPTTITQSYINHVINLFSQFGLTGNNAPDCYKYYAQDIIDKKNDRYLSKQIL